MSILFPEKNGLFYFNGAVLWKWFLENVKMQQVSSTWKLVFKLLRRNDKYENIFFFFYKKVNFLQVLSPKLEVVLEITYQPLSLHTSPSPNSLSDKAKISRKFPSDLFFYHLGSLKSVEKVSRFIWMAPYMNSTFKWTEASFRKQDLLKQPKLVIFSDW